MSLGFCIDHSYYANGNVAPYTKAIWSRGQNQYLYNGKELQEETGWYDYHARMYDPVIGRWNVVDPMSESFFGVSPYSYVLNDPINYTDPTGMYPSGAYGNHGAPGLDPDYRLKQLQQEGLRHGIPDWAWDIGGGIQDVLFQEQYGMSRQEAMERQMQYDAWRSTLSELNIQWDPSTYYVKSRGVGLENFENGRMIYNFSIVKRDLPSSAELYGQQQKGGYYDWSNTKTTLDYTGGIFGGLETTVRPGNQWLGKNGKYYNMSWGGNQYTGGRSGAVKAANFYKLAGKATVAATVIVGGIETYNGYQMDGGQFGYNANSAAAQTVGGIAGSFGGAVLGAKIGAGFGALFGGVGAVPGAVIGGFIGGWIGGEIGTSAGRGSVNWYYGR